MLVKFGNVRKLTNTVLVRICVFSCIFTVVSGMIFPGITTGTTAISLPRVGQGMIALSSSQVSNSSSNSPFSSDGNIIYAPIFLDGRQLFHIAAVEARSSNSDANVNIVSPLEARVRMYEEKLRNLLTTGFNPQTLVTTVDQREGQTVILVGDGNKLKRQQALITVTEIDAQIHGLSVTDLANRFSSIIRRALIRAQIERQPEYLRNKAFASGFVFLGIIIITGIIGALYKGLLKKWDSFHKVYSQELTELSDSQVNLPVNSQTSLQTQYSSDEEEKAAQVMTLTNQKLIWQRKFNFNRLWRLLLVIGIFLVWVLGFAWISGQFPFTRWLEDWLLTKPILLGIILSTILAIKVANIAIDYLFKKLLDTQSQIPNTSARTLSRLTTFSNVVKGIVCFLLVGVGGIFFLQKLHVPIVPFLAGAGIIGFAISFSSQNLIRDFINGVLILWEDQFAIGDVIDVGSTVGLVEDMNLRMTQIRGRGGRLSTVPNSAIATVHNLTKNWSRIDWTIEISPDSDVDKALSIIKQVGSQMQQDSEWGDAVIDPANVLGVNDISNNGIEILLWFKTKPGRQFAVGREFRRRLKYAFDRENIAIASPRQSVRLENYQVHNN
ncbi:MAG: mechanosensitive ion channel family protein [Cyanobacteria bacterium P01_A01_bin.84]